MLSQSLRLGAGAQAVCKQVNKVCKSAPICATKRSRATYIAVRANTDTASVVTADAPSEAITLTEKAVNHIKKLRQEAGSESLLLRVGVKQGGCSGMSYVMDFEKEENLKEDDYTIQYDGFKLACDPKSLLYLFGMSLDYSDALIGGGFQFHNPNAQDSCGCGKSFGV